MSLFIFVPYKMIDIDLLVKDRLILSYSIDFQRKLFHSYKSRFKLFLLLLKTKQLLPHSLLTPSRKIKAFSVSVIFDLIMEWYLFLYAVKHLKW